MRGAGGGWAALTSSWRGPLASRTARRKTSLRSLSDEAGRIASDLAPVGNRSSHDATGCHDTSAADVGHEDSALADPGLFPDARERRAGAFKGGQFAIRSEPSLVRTAQDADPAPEQGTGTQRDGPETHAASNVHAFADGGPAIVAVTQKADVTVQRAGRQGHVIIGPPQ